jgi:MFS family permease
MGGKFIQKGRRPAIIIFNIFAAISVTITLFLDVKAIIIGRFLFGFCCGVFSVAGPKMLDETVPTQYNSAFGTATNSCMSCGIMTALLLGALLPEDDDLEAQLKDNNWRIIYGFPYVCEVLTILMFMTCFKEDSITYSISVGDTESALRLISKVYRHDP